MKVTNKQIFDILSYSVRSGGDKEVNAYYALMTAPGISTLCAYHLRKTRKQMVAATEAFFEQRDDILQKHELKIDGDGIVPIGDRDDSALAAAVAEINELLAIEVDDIQSLRMSELIGATDMAKTILVEYDGMSAFEPLIEDDIS